MELVFHTTSGASRSRLPSTYLNVVTVLQTTFLLDLLKYWCIYIYNMLYSKTEIRKILPRRIEYDQLSGNYILGPTNPVLGDVGRKKLSQF